MRLAQGGSTITQQLAKNLFLTNKKTIKRKIQEIILASYIETQFSKEEILESYLNNVYFGSGNYGIEAASQDYFGKSIYDIEFEEAVILAGLLKAPTTYNPKYHKERSFERAEVVIGAMKDNGIKTPNYDLDSVKMANNKSNPELGNARYFTDFVKDAAFGYIGEPKQDLIIKTTLDLKLQAMAEKSIGSYEKEIREREANQISFLSMQKDGAIIAMMGGFDYSESQFNRVYQSKRQTGSAFKPIVYLAALEKGMKPRDQLEDKPIKIGNWEPQNFDLKFHGMMGLYEAFAYSYNVPAVKLLQHIGIDSAIAMTRKLGITADIERNLTMALGSNSISLLELTNAYTIIANGGYNVSPYAITSIKTKDGDIIYEHTPDNQKIIGKKAIKHMNSMMNDVIRIGTGKKAQIDRIKCYGKTGTTQRYKDAWFIGYTDKLITGIWIGNDDASPTKRITGGSIPTKLWKNFNEQSYNITVHKRASPKRSFWDVLKGFSNNNDLSPASSTKFN